MGALGRVPLFLAGAALIVLSNAQNVNLSTLGWGSGVWASPRPKMVVVPAGVTIGSLNPSLPAMDTGTGWGGLLTIVNSGSIEGAGGLGGTSTVGGNGGTALLARANGGNKPRLVNNTLVAGGGGGGGRGGQGGAGQFAYTAQEGPLFQDNVYKYQWSSLGFGLTKIYWAGAVLTDEWNASGSSRTIGGYTYYRSSFQFGENYSIFRQWTAYQSTAGGAGGAGGRGRGYAQSAASGSAGSAGATNAGTGGTGGTGGDRGQSGSTGGTGSSGNVAGGAAGSTGGLAGWGIENTTNIIVSGPGTIITR